jgi:hypothetical protein
MGDAFYLILLVAFALLSWGLLVLCDRLKGGQG